MSEGKRQMKDPSIGNWINDIMVQTKMEYYITVKKLYNVS